MTPELHTPPNYLHRIDQVWMFVSVDEHGEGVCSVPMGNTQLPMIAADEARLESLRDWAQQLATLTDSRIKLIRLSVREELETIEP